MKKDSLRITIALLFVCSILSANNIQVSNISLTNQDVGQNTIFVQFDLSWENSWRVSAGPANWDAAWVFLKYRVSGGNWNHVNINYVNGTNDGHQLPTGATIKTVSNGIGGFIYRAADGTGNVNFQGIQLLWNYGAVGLEDDALIEVKVFGIEMVYVPTGQFKIGTGSSGTEINKFYNWPFGAAYSILSENAINVAPAFGTLYYGNQAGSNGGDQQGPIPAAYPKGYNAFYCMKYELSQGQFVGFFNTLTEAQKLNHDLSDTNHKNSDGVVARNGFAWESGYATTSLPDVPLNYYNWSDITAYLDWAGLRPITELEYEKACRGTLSAVPGEFAWGNTEIPDPTGPYTLLNEGTPNEIISNPAPEQATVSYQPTAIGIGGPFRCGIHAASAITKNRTESGGSYYGIMELTGNLYERVVSVGSPNGRAFTGAHGDGVLSGTGLHNVPNWPLGNTGGTGYRGGSYANGSPFIRVSDRYDAANPTDIVNSRIGSRGGRTE
jgi:formylglycine-generating enzyme required for sulfatase activity